MKCKNCGHDVYENCYCGTCGQKNGEKDSYKEKILKAFDLSYPQVKQIVRDELLILPHRCSRNNSLNPDDLLEAISKNGGPQEDLIRFSELWHLWVTRALNDLLQEQDKALLKVVRIGICGNFFNLFLKKIEASPYWISCPNCGESSQTSKYCISCGKQLKPER